MLVDVDFTISGCLCLIVQQCSLSAALFYSRQPSHFGKLSVIHWPQPSRTFVTSRSLLHWMLPNQHLQSPIGQTDLSSKERPSSKSMEKGYAREFRYGLLMASFKHC